MRGDPANTCTSHNPPRKGTWARDGDSYQQPAHQTSTARVRRPLGHPGGGPSLDTCKQSTQARRPLLPRSNGPDLERKTIYTPDMLSSISNVIATDMVKTQRSFGCYNGTEAVALRGFSYTPTLVVLEGMKTLHL
ncbi:hypothetical protein AgCh_027223 [Apium graveolens]